LQLQLTLRIMGPTSQILYQKGNKEFSCLLVMSIPTNVTKDTVSKEKHSALTHKKLVVAKSVNKMTKEQLHDWSDLKSDVDQSTN